MWLTIYSFYMAVAWSSVLIIMIYLCRKTHLFIHQFGVMSLLVLYLFCVLRMVVPLEFTFTKGVNAEGTFSMIFKNIAINKIGTSEMSVLSILFLIWILISAVLILRFACQYYMTMRRVSTYAVREDDQCKRVFALVVKHSKKQMNITVRRSSDVNIPIGIGIFNKSIILPDEDYPDQELYWILSHEYTHFLNRDLFVKMLTHIFCYIFWWNPVVYLLKKDLSQTLEIKCDLCVTAQMNAHDKADYLKTIVSILKRANTNKEKILLHEATELVSKDGETEIVERFNIISKNHQSRSKHNALVILWLSVYLLIFVFSYSIVFVPYYKTAPIEEIETEPNTKEVRPDNSYIIKNKDGTYTIVMPDNVRQNIEKEKEEFILRMKEQGFSIIEEEE